MATLYCRKCQNFPLLGGGNILKSNLIVFKRLHNRKTSHISKKERKRRIVEAKKYNNSVSETSNHFAKPEVEVLPIPRAMKPDDDSQNLHLENSDWLYWKSVESKIDFESLFQRTKENVLNIMQNYEKQINSKSNSNKNDPNKENIPIRFNNPLQKATVLSNILARKTGYIGKLMYVHVYVCLFDRYWVKYVKN